MFMFVFPRRGRRWRSSVGRRRGCRNAAFTATRWCTWGGCPSFTSVLWRRYFWLFTASMRGSWPPWWLSTWCRAPAARSASKLIDYFKAFKLKFSNKTSNILKFINFNYISKGIWQILMTSHWKNIDTCFNINIQNSLPVQMFRWNRTARRTSWSFWLWPWTRPTRECDINKVSKLI